MFVVSVGMHRYPGSTRQSIEHPSPDITFPSSHCSNPYLIPFPQFLLQILPEIV